MIIYESKDTKVECTDELEDNHIDFTRTSCGKVETVAVHIDDLAMILERHGYEVNKI